MDKQSTDLRVTQYKLNGILKVFAVLV